ncbi:MAG: hypothetical protein QM529_07165 [Hydrotalea sp.]|nr:hypothetical protein [Hydrotalea sp.]
MTIRQIIEQTDFNTGIIDPNYMGNENTTLYQHGARKLENFEVRLEGTLTRRAGLAIMKKLTGNYANHLNDVRLLSSQWGRTTGAIIAIKPGYVAVGNGLPETGNIDIFDQQGNRISFGIHNWGASIVQSIKVTDTTLGTLLCQDGILPTLITCSANTPNANNNTPYQFNKVDFVFEKDANNVPFMPFETFANGVFMSCSAASTTPAAPMVTIKTTSDYFIGTGVLADHVNTCFKLFGGVVQISSVIDKRNAYVRILSPLTGWTSATTNGAFTEQAFSFPRGYPRVGITYQGRMIFGGTKSFPAKIWMSKLGNYYNFDLGSSGDGDAIVFNITADQAEEVQWLVAGRYLEIYTNLAEWSCPVDSLTPTTLGLARQSRYGMSNQAATPPLSIEGSTVFLGKDQRTLHQVQWSDINKGYTHAIINRQAQSLTTGLTALHYDPQKKLLYGLKTDGTLAVMTYYQEAQIFAWGQITTNGTVVGIVAGRNNIQNTSALVEQPYLLVKRGAAIYVETFDSNYIADGVDQKPAMTDRVTTFSLENFCAGQAIALYQHGQLKKTMVAPSLTPATPAVSLTLPPELDLNTPFAVGLVFGSVLKPLHRFSGPGGRSSFSAMKLARLSFLVKDTPVLCWQNSDGKKFQGAVNNYVFNPATNIAPSDGTPPSLVPYSGWATFALPGWLQEVSEALWQISYQNPYPLTLLSAKEEYLLSTISNQTPTN